MSGDPRWYQDAIIYQTHVRAFHDSNADGYGDFAGLTEKLDYLQDLGVTAVWLLPFYPSPLRDDGYDIADYMSVHPAYGTLRDFRTFLREAHRRDLQVITELVVNHTSDQHPWFQTARRAKPGSRARDFYVWSDTPDRWSEARIIFKDFESSNWSWDPVAGAYYWHRFYSHQPDLNFDNPAVRRALYEALDFWLEMGVDGMRLDAVPYLYERDGTNCENLPETHAFLKELRRHVDANYAGRMLLAEANQWPEDAVAYFGDGDECHMAFHFPVMPRLFMAIHMEDRFPVVDILEQTPPIPEGCQWAIFLRNHDELTLEMVTDEERDYMYRVYAHDPQARINLGIRRRLAPLLGNNRRKIELMNSLLLSLPGTPVIYYGDEIGMGDNIYLGDRNGVRTPMQWSADRNAGFSRGNPQQLYLPVIIDPEYHYESINVEAQQNNPHSLLWWMKRVLAVRKRYRSFSRGSFEFLHPENRKILAFVRRWEDERLLVVVNLSRFVQAAELDLSEFTGQVPVELFGQTQFPAVTDRPYFVTLGPHAFYWFALQPAETLGEPVVISAEELPLLTAANDWTALIAGKETTRLERILPAYFRARRWFAGKARSLLSTRITETLPVRPTGDGPHMLLVQAAYREGDPDTYLLPLSFTAGQEGEELLQNHPGAVVARVQVENDDEVTEGVLHDAVVDPDFTRELLELVTRRRRRKADTGVLRSSRTRKFKSIRGPAEEELQPSLLGAEQSNTSVVYGERMILKLFRRLDRGTNPDLEIGRFLTERTSFANAPQVAGALSYEPNRGQPMTLAILHEFVPNEGDAWRYTLDELARYFERVLARPSADLELGEVDGSPLDNLQRETPQLAGDQIGGYLEFSRLLGQRTGELHIALASRPDESDFAPEPFNAMYRRSLYQASRVRAEQALDLLRTRMSQLPKEVRGEARSVLNMKSEIDRRLHAVVDGKVRGSRIRCHGDYHLGQVLFTGRDFVIMDFEGEPARTISERRLKRSPLRDVAGMLRSFHYAAVSAHLTGSVRPEDVSVLEPWGRLWYLWVATEFLRGYFDTVADGGFLPPNDQELAATLDLCLLDKALYELSYELNQRPEWVHIPLRGITSLLKEPARQA
ncbi:MAG: maltose alpha-D-glucosyltransferase [Gemmatimonadetes bacterium]|uniref:Maltokinase n=1 Tax=Candidatus Kutchimonas denitrificans TaxID=3056748 RepID=A0AAE4ZBD4_9BACT|nr:maltose alpha-D-glucosyltransferase [Gemmatimonadota bacterium]NIR76618.1 maltose alpha-D-glucosyltransferase [Candidatus Kutchimonas denitrificans]NIS03387.1 maltose alpha-D-glucosyltransferase [Gemmatimonadota bacterium]NIT69248.1 maltose alpha-D-glucosyltransferase [Gemmatimonadota bacterium]NIU54720.1 maltose alpha-D-glucosyltransferase [Gemmatimonadota bacterium]